MATVLPLAVRGPSASELERVLRCVDRIPPLETHKIALLYAGGRGVDEASVLNNAVGSDGYVRLQRSLGKLVPLADLGLFSGGLDTASGADGEFALVWTSGGTMVLFHTPTLMPEGLFNRKRHVGNDFVHVVFVEDGVEYDCDTISGAFGLVTVIVTPFAGTEDCKVEVQLRKPANTPAPASAPPTDDPHSHGHHNGPASEPAPPGDQPPVCPDQMAALLAGLVCVQILPWSLVASAVRQVAIRADLACRVLYEDQLSGVSNWEERLLQLRRIDARQPHEPT